VTGSEDSGYALGLVTVGPPTSDLSLPAQAGAEATSDLTVGEALGPYTLLAVLQRGGMGELFVAEDTENEGRRVVIKRLLEDFVEDESYLAMFRDEARIMSQLQHDNVVRVLATPVLRGSMCLVMELVPGRSVAQILTQTRAQATRIPPRLAVYVMSQALRGLHYAHTAVDETGQALELVHRDVSPGNLLVSFDGQVKVTDFGIAKSKLSVVATSVGVVKGTTRYLSPEQIRGANVTAQADVFACAAVLTEMLTGEAVFDRGQVPPTLLAIVKGQRPPISDLLPFDAPDLAMVLEQALALGPVHRPASAQAMADALDALLPQLGPTVQPADLGDYLATLFPDRVPGGDPTKGGPLGATYLLDAEQQQEASLPTAAVAGSMPGAAPLDATEFEGRPLAAAQGALLGARGSDPSRPLFEPDAATSNVTTRKQLNFVDEVEAAARELEVAPASPPARPTPAEEPGVSDSAVEADAFQVSNHTRAVPAPRFAWSTFFMGSLAGGLAVFALMTLTQQSPPSVPGGVQAPPVAPTPAAPPPVPLAVTPTQSAPIRMQPIAVSDAPPPELPSESAPELAVQAEPGYLTIKRPRRARVTIHSRDGVLKRRVPLRRFQMPAGPLRVQITRGKMKREVEVQLQPGQHLDLTRSQIRVLEEGPAAPKGGQAAPQ